MSTTQTRIDHFPELLQLSLRHWDVSGRVEIHSAGSYTLTGAAFDIVIERCAEGLPFRWAVRTLERTRTASSINGILKHVRSILGVNIEAVSMNFAHPVDSLALISESESPRPAVSRQAEQVSEASDKRIPIVVLTGYLGSGKTTLLSSLLNHAEFSRTAVIVNEFGEIGIDHELIETSEESVVQLTTGCLCCLAQDDLGQTLNDLFQRRDRGEISRFDRVVIETSGLADPAPILQSLIRNPAISPHFQLDRVITTVDVLTATALIEVEPEFVKQVAFADQIVLTKTDVAESVPRRLTNYLRSVNHSAPFTDRWQQQTPDDWFFKLTRSVATQACEIDRYEHRIDGAVVDAHARHSMAVQAVCISREQPLAAAALTLFLEALAEQLGLDLLRLKGLINLRENTSQPYVIHGVQHVFHSPVWRDQWPGPDQRSRLVLLGRNLPEAMINRMLDAICQEVDAIQTRTSGHLVANGCSG